MLKNLILLSIAALTVIGCGKSDVHPYVPPVDENQFSDAEFGSDLTFEVLTWNIKEFPENGTVTVDLVEDAVEAMDADIIALQEISSSFRFAALLDSLPGWEGHMGDGDNYGHNLAMIWKTDVISGQTYTILDNDWYAFPRSPQVFEGTWNDKPFVIINNHLKASGGSENEDRRLQASIALKEYVEEYLVGQKVIITGDLNDEIQEEQYAPNVFWNFISDENYLFVDMDIAEGSSSQWSFPSWPSHLDHILINEQFFAEYNVGTAEVRTIQLDDCLTGGLGEYRDDISDHLPVGLKMHLF
ncbi:MAG: hypothetical protein GY893_00110 [bacterium]|nr:hypothetical protein [bacterium]